MIGLSYQFQGIEVAQARLSALRDLRGLDGELEAAGDQILPVLRIYPPERPKQRYVRTFRFRDSWRRRAARRIGNGIAVDLDNDTPYGADLVGDTQGMLFRGRWWKLHTVADAQRPIVRARAQGWALRAWRGA